MFLILVMKQKNPIRGYVVLIVNGGRLENECAIKWPATVNGMGH